MDNFFALIIGVGGMDIPETVADAEAIHDVLTTKGAYSPTNTFYLTEDKSTKENIIKSLDRIIKKTKDAKNSTVFIYYSGHGQRFPMTASTDFEYYLVTYGANRNNKEKTMLNGDIFSKKIEKIKANRILVLLDCCHAGGIKKEHLKIKKKEEILYSNRALQEKLKSGKGRVFISSCDDNETSVILPGAQNSLFTEVALEVLNGFFSKDKEYVSVLDFIYHVLNEVPNRILPFKHNQNPILTNANNLSHKYYICKNGRWKPISPPSDSLTLKYLNIDKKEKTSPIKISSYNDLSNKEKEIANNFFNKINFDSTNQNEFKAHFINEIGGLEALKRLYEKINHLDFDKVVYKTSNFSIDSILNIIKEKNDEKVKFDFINNYKNKI